MSTLQKLEERIENLRHRRAEMSRKEEALRQEVRHRKKLAAQAERIAIGKNIKEARGAARFSQTHLGRIGGFSAARLYQWESGNAACNPEHLARIADLCGVTVAYLTGEEVER